MKLKCFGGLYDQKYQIVDDYYKQGDIWRIRERTSFITSFTIVDEISANITEKFQLYVIETMRVKDLTLKFLRYEHLPIEDLMTKIFT